MVLSIYFYNAIHYSKPFVFLCAGDVKLFDFGLVENLDGNLVSRHGMCGQFHLRDDLIDYNIMMIDDDTIDKNASMPIGDMLRSKAK